MADVFLSYSSKDRAAAERVEAALSAQGIDVFWDQETPPGVDWDTWIRDKLATCKAAVVLWSKASIASPNVRHEAIVARDAGKLVPVMIETLAASDFPMGLYLVQAVNLQDWRNAKSGGMERLVAEVQARMGRGPASGETRPKAGKIASVKQPSGVPMVIAALALIAVVGGGALWMWSQGVSGRPEDHPVDAQSAAIEPTPPPPGPSCLDNSPIDASGYCANGNRPIPAAPVLGGPATEMLSRRIVGRWHWDDQSCRDGTNITLEDGKLVFATRGQVKFVHAIETDTDRETRTRVMAPDYVLGEQYSLKPEYLATSSPRNFQLVVHNLTADSTDTWYPCEPAN